MEDVYEYGFGIILGLSYYCYGCCLLRMLIGGRVYVCTCMS